jgi:hypothetical protein
MRATSQRTGYGSAAGDGDRITITRLAGEFQHRLPVTRLERTEAFCEAAGTAVVARALPAFRD